MTTFSEGFIASAAHPDDAAGLALFGQFVGEWRIAHRGRTRGTPWVEAERTWIFSWALGGRAVASVLLDAAGTPVGQTVQVREAASDLWRITSTGIDGSALLLVGTAWGDDGIRQEGIQRTAADPEGLGVRWNFSKITADSFEWDGWVAEPEDGPNWEQQQHLVATRVR
jgi:hypothetical protein